SPDRAPSTIESLPQPDRSGRKPEPPGTNRPQRRQPAAEDPGRRQRVCNSRRDIRSPSNSLRRISRNRVTPAFPVAQAFLPVFLDPSQFSSPHPNQLPDVPPAPDPPSWFQEKLKLWKTHWWRFQTN